MDEIREEATTGLGLDNGYASTVILDAFEVIETLRRRNKKLECLYQAIKHVEADDSYGAGGFRCHDDCNSNHAWGKEAPCDCYIREIRQILDRLGDGVLDDLVGD